MALSTIGTNQIASEAVTVPKVADQVLSNRNIVINGAMNLSQRSVSVTGLGDDDEEYVTVDRMRHTAAASAGRFTSAQTAVSDLPGFLNCLHLDCTTADTSIASSELLALEHRIEGQNLQQLKKGTSSAESVTVSFYMKTNAAFVFMCVLNDFDNNRVNTQKFTTTTDWTRHSITFVGDTSGALGDDANNSLSVSIYLHAGSNHTGGTYVANTWQSRASSDNMIAPGISSFYSSTNNDVKLTGLQMEIGTSATPFEHEDVGTTLRKCQRYLYRLETESTSGAFANLTGWSADATFGPILYPVEMRSAPALSYGAALNDFLILSAGTNPLPTAILSNGSSKRMMELSILSTGNVVTGRSYWSRISDVTNGFIQWDAEL